MNDNKTAKLSSQLWRMVGGLFLLLLGLGSLSANTLNKLNFSALPDDKVRVTLEFADSATNPSGFTTDDPARIALDFMGVSNQLSQNDTAINLGKVSSVAVVEASGRTRVVFNLVELIPYDVAVKGKEVSITLGHGVSGNTATAALAQPMALQESGIDSIKQIDFRRGGAGEGRILVTLSNPATVVDIREESGNVVAVFSNVQLPANLERRMDVIDFATPVKMVDVSSKGKDVKIVVMPVSTYSHLVYQTGELLTLEFKPIAKEEKEEEQKKQFGFTGERLSLNFQDIEVRAVLQLLADFTDLNIIVSDTVKGNLTLRLKNVPWDQALDIILKTKGLAQRQMGNVILVAPTEEISNREKLELEGKKMVRELEPLRNEYIQVNYAKAGELMELLKKSDNSLLSQRGQISVDTRTNTLLILDTPTSIDAIRKLIAKLDVAVRQVLIESRVVIANEDFAKDLGVNLGFAGTTNDSSGRIYSVGGGLAATDALTGKALSNLQSTGQPYPVAVGSDSGGVTSPSLGDRLNVNLPGAAAGNPGRIAFAVLGSKYLVDLELSALQQDGRGEVISSPRVITSDQKESFIEQGKEIPYQEATSSGATSVSFKKAVLSLKVTPHITPDDRIIMDLEVKKDSPDFSRAVNGTPPIDTRKIQTRVLVSNGETIVLGGIYEETDTVAVNKVPMLGDLPFLGVLFRDRSVRNGKTELLIFVTPKIVKETFKTTVN